MMKSLAFLTSGLLGAVALAMALPAQAQAGSTHTLAAPDYDSGAAAGSLSNGNFTTPESDGRPGVYYFDLGAQAFKNGDYRHAIDMYKVAASWAYKPAEYNLGLMYFKGQGVPVDHARGAAWMVLAAERGDPLYVKARDLMVTLLTKAEFARTDEIWNQLKPTYGDEVALRRAKARWAWVRSHKTGTRVGDGAEHLLVGGGNNTAGPTAPGSNPSIGAIGRPAVTTGWGVFRGSQITDGSIAYRQFQESDNPYDPIFIKNRTGTATVGPLEQVKPGNDKPPPKKKDSPAPPSTQPPRNA